MRLNVEVREAYEEAHGVEDFAVKHAVGIALAHHVYTFCAWCVRRQTRLRFRVYGTSRLFKNTNLCTLVTESILGSKRAELDQSRLLRTERRTVRQQNIALIFTFESARHVNRTIEI